MTYSQLLSDLAALHLHRLYRKWRKLDESKTLQLRLVRKQLNVITCT
jgi:hypothetical protein